MIMLKLFVNDSGKLERKEKGLQSIVWYTYIYSLSLDYYLVHIEGKNLPAR